LLISVIFIASIICSFLPRRAKPVFALIVSIFALFGSYELFRLNPARWGIFGYPALLRIDNLSAFIVLFVAVFGLLIVLYSIGFMKEKVNPVRSNPAKRDVSPTEKTSNGVNIGSYYAYLLATIAGSIGAALANNLLLFIAFWGFLAITLYLLVGMGGDKAKGAAKKTFIIIGGSDALMLLGLAIIWKLKGSMNMDGLSLPLDNNLAIFAFVLLALGAFAKAGAIPLHTWIPASSEVAPLPVMAFLPASLDKLLGIYFLARLSLNIFVVKANSAMSIFLLIIGAVTVIAAVMMALIQHNMKRLLSYHAVSQVGYMILGIGTANPIGIAGGLFHMLNNAIYKNALFLTGGAIEKEAGTTDLDKLGGIAHFMPITFLCCLVSSLAISGIPPFNGFVSKWMVYQGIIELGKTGSKLWVIWLTAAMFGSALTLASFMKLLHATFLGQQGAGRDKRIKEVPVSMWLPMTILALLCIVFGIFAFTIPLKYFIIPAVSAKISYLGLWQPGLATILILIGLAVGAFIYFLGTIKTTRTVEPFTGGEVLPVEERPTGTEFYNTIVDIPIFGKMYKMAKGGLFDIYEVGRKITSGFTRALQYLHNGILPTYLTWCLIGMLILFIVLMRLFG
jgi:formate hydrogenlyase subunit 3/multisubunit Na+/H+ antiporter MnhD subunit